MHESHAIVLMAYTMNSSLHSELNWATSTAGSSPENYRHNFSFKYFHFYLTTAIQIMKQWQSSKESMEKPKCYRVHRGVKDLYIEAAVGSRVRFGRFTSTSRLWNEAQRFGNETLFTVTTCLGAAVQGFSYHTSEKEVLIPPYEVFFVKSFFRSQHGNRLHLHSVGNYSKYHCQLVEGIVHSPSCRGLQDSLVSSAPKSPHQLHLHRAMFKAQSVACPLCSPMRATWPSFYLFVVKPGSTPQLNKGESTWYMGGLRVLCSLHLSHLPWQGCHRTCAFVSLAFLLQRQMRFAGSLNSDSGVSCDRREEGLPLVKHTVSSMATEITLCWKTSLGLFHTPVLLWVHHQYGTLVFVSMDNSAWMQTLSTKLSFRNESFCPDLSQSSK